MADPKAAMAAILEKYSPKNSKSGTTSSKAAETESTSKAKKAMDEILKKYSPKPDVLDALPGLRGKETEIFKPSPIYDYTGASRKKSEAKQGSDQKIEYDSGSVLKLGAGPLSSNAVTSGVVSGKLELTSQNKDGKYSVEKNTEYVAPKKKADIIDRSPARMAELEAVKNPSEAQIEELAIIKKELAEKAEAAKLKEEREPGDNWFSWLGKSRDSTLPLSTADTQAQKAIGNSVGAAAQNVAGSLMSVIATLNELDARTRARDEADSAKLKAAQSALENGEEVDLGRSEETWRADMTAKTDEYTAKVKKDLAHEFSGILMNNAEQLRNEAYRAAGDEGKFLVDLLYTGTQMAGDFVANVIVPGSGLWLMSARVFGRSAYEARENGADAATQFVTGLKSAVIEYLTEKLGGGAFKRIYGAGMVDNAIESVLGRLFKTDTGRTVIRYIMTAVNEGNEEVLSDVLNPVADRLLGLDDGEGALFTDEDLGQMWYDWMLGTALGGIGAAVNIAGGSNAEQNADLRLTESAQKALVESGLESDTNTESYKLAEKYKKTLDSGRLLSNMQVKKLTEANDAAIRNEVALQSAIDAVKQTVPERAARMFAERGEQASPELISGVTNLITDQQVTQEQAAAIVASDNSAEVVQQLAQEYITQEAPDVQESAPVDGPMELWDGNNIVESMFPNEVKNGILSAQDVADIQSYYDESGRSIDLNELEAMVRDYIENKKEAKTNEGRKQSSDGGVGREPDVGAGEQAGRIPKSAGRNKSEKRENDTGGEETRRPAGKKPQREKVSGKSLNIPNGTDSQKLTVVKPDGVNARIVEAFSAAAKSITLVNGAIEQQKNDAVITVSGLTTADGRVFARADHRLYNGTKLLLHECGHLYMDDAQMRREMHNAAAEFIGERTLEELANSYALLWKGLYKMPAGITTDEELADYFENNPDAYTQFLEAYEQEIWCDALAGLDRIKAAGASKLTDTVRSIFKDYTGIDVDAILSGEQSEETEAEEAEELDADIEERAQAPPEGYEQISIMSAAETAEAEQTAIEEEVEAIAEEAAAETPIESEADNDPELHEKTEQKKQPGEIQDFGEKIGGARKDVWAASGLTTYDMMQMTEAEKGKYVKKDSVWPKINYQELADSGIDKDVVFFIKQVRDALPAAPQVNYNDADLDARREQYIEFVQAIRSGMEKVRTKADAILAFENIMVGNGWYSTASASSYSRGNWTKEGRDNIQITNKLINALSVSERRWNYDVVKKMEKVQFLVPKEDKLPTGVQIKFYDGGGYSRNDNWKPGTWYVTKGYTILSTNFESEKSAKEWAQTNIKTKGSGKTRFVPRQLESVHRTGRDYRNSNSTDIEGEDYMQTFGFRGGEFGNWVNQTERQVSLNYGFDALMDLADVLGIEPSSIALDGRLAIAFGARGHAGAAAHFEPEREVINLTKMNGAGSLAHEWLHALDYIGGKLLGQQKSMIEGKYKLDIPELTQLIEDMKSKPMEEDEALALAEQTEKRRRDSTERLINSYFKTADMTAEQIQKLDELKAEAVSMSDDMASSMRLAGAISDLRKEYKGRVIPKEERTQLGYSIYRARIKSGTNARTATEFYKNSKRFDKIFSKENNAGYWASDEEMMARAFACYVSDKLAASDLRSDYLSGSSEHAVTFDTTPDDKMVVIKAIPEGEERAKLNEDFDALIEALKNKGVLQAAAPATEEYAVTSYSIDEDEESYSADEEGYIENGDSARMTSARIDYLIADSGAGHKKDYAQMWITSINPTDFINLTTDKVQDRKLFDKYPGDYGTTVEEYDFIEGLKSNMRQTPYLNIDEYGNVIGHEGRHRMRALERKGVTSAEIVVKFYDDEGSLIKNAHAVNGRLETIERATFSNQMGTGQTATVENLVPLNLDHKDEVLESYGEDHAAENDIRYSADDALLVESDPDYADTLSKVREDARRYSAVKLEERISNFDGRIKGYEETENRTERMELELEDLRNRRKVYNDALKRKKAKIDERRQANETAKTEAKATAQRITEAQGRNRSKATLRDTIFRDFNIQEGRSEAADVINAFADKYAEQGRISRKDLNGLFDTLMEKGLFVAEAEDYARELRAHLAGSSVRVPSYVKAEFGDDWINFYRRAWSNKIYLKIDSGSNGIDTWTQELAGSFGEGTFDTSADMKTQLERIVELAEQGRDEKMDLFHMAEYVRKREGRDTADAIVDELYQKLENAVKTYASNAKLEMELTYKNAFQQARDRAIRQENARRAQEKKELRERQQDTLKQLQILKRMRDTTSQEFREQIDRVLDGIDTIAVSAANAMNYSDKYNATWGSIVAMYNEAKANDPNWLPDAYVEKLIERIDIDVKHLDEMEPADLEQLYQAAVALRTKIYNTRNIIGSETNMMFSEAYDSVRGEMHGASKPKNRYGAKWAAMRNAMNPNHYLERLAGWNPDSVWYKTFAKGLEDGERKMKRYVETSKQMLDEFARTHRKWLSVADGQGKNGIWYEVKVSPVAEWRKGDQPIFGEPITVYMTPLQKVHMYLESKNYDNLAHMLGGRVFADRELYSKGNKAEAFASDPIQLAPADVRRISSDLTPEELELANILERYYNTYAKGEINKVSNELYGFDRAMAGNYAPIFTKDTYNTFTPAIIDGTAEGVGHMKTRIKGARTPTVNISAMDAFNKHVSQTSRFVGMSIPLHNMNGILNWTQNGKKMRSVIEQEWSKGDLKYIENLVTELENPHFADEGYIEKTIDKIQSAYIGSVFGFNPSVALKVFGSWNLASAELGFENVKGAFTKVDPELVRKYTSEYDVRVRGYASPEVARLVNSQGRIEKLIHSNKFTKEILGGGLMIHTDAMVARSIWAWSEAAVRNENPDLEVGTQEQIDAGQSPFYKAVAERYNTAIGNTQSMYDIMHRSALLRDEGAVSRAFTMFHTDIMQAANLLIKAKGEHDYYRKALAADPENKALQAKAAKYEHSVGKAATGVVTSSLLVALVSVLNKLYKRRDEFYDENKEFMWDKFGIDYATYILKDFTGMLPGVDVVASGLIDHFRGEKWYDVEVMGLSLFNDLVDKGIKVASKIIDGTATLEDYKDLAFLVARGFSLPLDNVERYTLGLFSWVAPEIGEAYNNMISPPDKSDLKGKSGEVLERDIYDMYKQFGLDRETTDELARLYDLGYDKIIYGATPDHITINGTEYELDDEAAERYSTALSETLSKVGEVISSDKYQEADDKERMGMLKRLNAYATEMAKAAAVPEYDMSQWAESCKGLVDSGESIMTVAMMPYTEKSSSSSSEDNDPRYVKFIKAGVEYNNARDIEEKLIALVPDAGKTNVSDFQKIKAIAEMPIPESDKAAALEVIAENTNFIRKLYGATSSKYSLLEICDIYSAVIAKSDKGSFTQDNFKEVVSERGIPYDVASAIWLAKWEPKNNPYD